MLNWLREKIEKTTGARRFAAGTLALYVVAWLAKGALTLFWEKILEKQTPAALRQLSAALATDLATGMAIMALLFLLVPPLAQGLFDVSSWAVRKAEMRRKRISKEEYISSIAEQAIDFAKRARQAIYREKAHYEYTEFLELHGQERWAAIDKKRIEQDTLQREAIKLFAIENRGQLNFLFSEFVEFGYASKIPTYFHFLENEHSLSEVADALEQAALSAKAIMRRDGYVAKQFPSD